MTVVLRKFKPRAVPETRMRPVNGCRASSLTIARKYETLGESFIRANGTCYSPENDETVMRLLRRLMAQHRGESVNTAKGFSRANALYAYAKAFPTGRAQGIDLLPAEMWDNLKAGWGLSVSGNVDDVPNGSKLDDYVNEVAHEIYIAPFPSARDEVRVYEPMTPISRSPILVKFNDLRLFSSEFATNGRRLCIRVKAGRDTKEARARRDLAETVAVQERRIARMKVERNDALADKSRLITEAAALQLQLNECRDDRPDVQGVIDAIEERLADLMASIKDDYT